MNYFVSVLLLISGSMMLIGFIIYKLSGPKNDTQGLGMVLVILGGLIMIFGMNLPLIIFLILAGIFFFILIFLFGGGKPPSGV